jgi:hypothetical protein
MPTRKLVLILIAGTLVINLVLKSQSDFSLEFGKNGLSMTIKARKQ